MNLSFKKCNGKRLYEKVQMRNGERNEGNDGNARNQVGNDGNVENQGGNAGNRGENSFSD